MSRRIESRGARALAGVGLTQAEVAAKAGLNQRTVGRVLSGTAGPDANEVTLGAIRQLAGEVAMRQVMAALIPAPEEAKA